MTSPLTVKGSERFKVKGLHGKISLPSDKSITHRAILLAAISSGESVIRAREIGRDNLRTLKIIEQLGAKCTARFPAAGLALAREEGIESATLAPDNFVELRIIGQGLTGLRESAADLYCGNSGTTARLLLGVLSGCPFRSTLTGDPSLSRRPFARLTTVLRKMGAQFSADTLPLTVNGGELSGIEFHSPVASAQLKSAVLLAGLSSRDATSVHEPHRSRDHTERMLVAMGVSLVEQSTIQGWRVSLPMTSAPRTLRPLQLTIPGDFSAAAFIIVAATIIAGSDVEIEDVGMNETRSALLAILRRMGAEIETANIRHVGGETVGSIRVRSAKLHGTTVTAAEVAATIDELPILSVAASVASGSTEILQAGELRLKESDRLTGMRDLLRRYGASAELRGDDLIVTRGTPASKAPGELANFPLDHRMVMTQAILELFHHGSLAVSDTAAVETSFPSFVECFRQLIG